MLYRFSRYSKINFILKIQVKEVDNLPTETQDCKYTMCWPDVDSGAGFQTQIEREQSLIEQSKNENAEFKKEYPDYE